MREWFLSTELVEIQGLPNTVGGISIKAKRGNWKSRKASRQGSALEYHISNFHEDVVAQLRELYDEEKSTTSSQESTDGSVLDTLKKQREDYLKGQHSEKLNLFRQLEQEDVELLAYIITEVELIAEEEPDNFTAEEKAKAIAAYFNKKQAERKAKEREEIRKTLKDVG